MSAHAPFLSVSIQTDDVDGRQYLYCPMCGWETEPVPADSADAAKLAHRAAWHEADGSDAR